MSALQAPTLKDTGRQEPLRYAWKASPYSSHSALLRLFPAEGRGRSVLDIGCGNGHLASALAARGFRVTGIDRPPDHPSEEPSDFPASGSLIERDLDQGLPPIYQKFDYLVCADILEHLRDPGYLLRQFHTVMAPGGELIASLPNSGNIYFRSQVALGRFPQHDQGLFDRTHLRFYTWAGWKQLFAANGFRMGTVQVTSVPFERAFASGGASVFLRAMEAFSFGLARAWKTLFAYQFVVTAVKDHDADPR
jgi:SAM-dependent methyltransferase